MIAAPRTGKTASLSAPATPRRYLATVALALFCAAGSAAGQALTTTFTYQGELRNGAAAASGLHDLRFRLFDAATGGAPVGLELCANNVSVVNGRFTVDLDFGAQFASQQRFIGASGTKSFRIDHPADPAHKYLIHYCHEGPEPQNAELYSQPAEKATFPSRAAEVSR